MAHFIRLIFTVLIVAGLLTACGRNSGGNSQAGDQERSFDSGREEAQGGGTTIWELFSANRNPETQTQVNRYLWAASLEVLDFLPIQSVDPFTGVIVTGYGRPQGGGRAYRATVLIDDPALDARSLSVALQSRGGAVSPSTVRAVEDAILTRARQLRVADKKL